MERNETDHLACTASELENFKLVGKNKGSKIKEGNSCSHSKIFDCGGLKGMDIA